jgi:hypothetical protein
MQIQILKALGDASFNDLLKADADIPVDLSGRKDSGTKK